MQNKNIIRFCFIGIFFIVIANIILYRQLIVEKVILDKVSSNNELLVSTYLRYASRFCQNIFVDDISSNEVLKSCSRDLGIEQFSRVFFKNLDILKVVLQDDIGNIVFENNDLKIIPINKTVARAGKEIAPLLDHLVFKDLISQDKIMLNAIVQDNTLNYKSANIVVDEKFLETIDGKQFTIRFYKDISHLWSEMSYIEVKIFFAISSFFVVLFIVIIYNTRFAQKIIDQQSEANKALAVAKQKAEQESSSKSQFLANVSHELRTPLNSIIGFSEIILADRDNPKKSKPNLDYVQDIYDSGKHLLAIINDILDYSRIIAGKLPADMMDLNVNKAVSYSMRFIEPRADKAGIKLIKDFPKDPPVIKADSKRLRQALLNVLSNAVKFTPEGGSVTLKIEQDTKKVHIRIIDTGIGIAKANIPKALSSFQQVEDKKARQYEGTGLGLPLTKKLIELMKGKFSIKSKEGKGTVITFTFKRV